MNLKLAASCVVIATLLAPVASFAADSDADRKHPLTFIKDSSITVKVKAMLADEKMSSLTHIKVDTTNKGEVVLSGTVKSAEAAEKAVSIARAVVGVTSVSSTTRVKKDD